MGSSACRWYSAPNNRPPPPLKSPKPLLAKQEALFPHEARFLKDPTNLRFVVKRRDVHLVGEFCHCLKVGPVLLAAIALYAAPSHLSCSTPGSVPLAAIAMYAAPVI
jgi:hypothetical protein